MLVKICGIRRLIDIDYVNELKPDFIGFVFAKSKRQISIDFAKELKARLDKGIKAVGVFRNDPIELVKEAVENNVIDYIQLHGDEDDEYIKKVREFSNKPIIKAYRDSNFAEYALYDNPDPGKGNLFDWSTIRTTKPFFIAGGLDVDNVNGAKELYPYCIDVSSGVETDGFKDYEKMKEFIRRCRNE